MGGPRDYHTVVFSKRVSRHSEKEHRTWSQRPILKVSTLPIYDVVQIIFIFQSETVYYFSIYIIFIFPGHNFKTPFVEHLVKLLNHGILFKYKVELL